MPSSPTIRTRDYHSKLLLLLAAASFSLKPASAQFWPWEPAPAPAPAPEPTPRPPTRRPTPLPPTLPTGGTFINHIDNEPDWLLGKCEGDCDKDEVRLQSAFWITAKSYSRLYFGT